MLWKPAPLAATPAPDPTPAPAPAPAPATAPTPAHAPGFCMYNFFYFFSHQFSSVLDIFIIEYWQSTLLVGHT